MEFGYLDSDAAAEQEEILSGNVPEIDESVLKSVADAVKGGGPLVIDEARMAMMAALVAKAAGVDAVVVDRLVDEANSAVTLVILSDGSHWKVEPGPDAYLSVTSPDGVSKLIAPDVINKPISDPVAAVTPSEAPVDAVVAPKALTPLDALMRFSAGHVSADDVNVPKSPTGTGKSTSSFSSIPEMDPSIRSVDDLAQLLDDDYGEGEVRLKGGNSAFPGQRPVVPARGNGDLSGGAGQVMQGVPGVPGQRQVGQTIGEMAGRALGGAVTAPFVAFSTAARHIKDHFSKPTSMLPPGAAGMPAPSQTLSIANTMEKITQWKCERIEKAAGEVARTADALSETDGFAVWDDEMRKEAQARGLSPADIVARMRTDPDLAGVREKMDQVWKTNPEQVAAYREACDDFERNVRNVIAEFANSDEDVQNRVTGAMKKVEKRTEGIPGFGQDFGEYLRSLAERIRELAQMIAEFMSGLARKLGGRTRTNDVVPS